MFRLQQNTNFIDDGEDDDVDRDERDNSIDDIHGESWTFWGAGTGIIGYSF